MMNMFNLNGGVDPSLAKVLRSNGVIFNDTFINKENYVMEVDVKKTVYNAFGNGKLLDSMDIDEEREEKNCGIKVEYGQVDDTRIFKSPLLPAIKCTQEYFKDVSSSEKTKSSTDITGTKEEPDKKIQNIDGEAEEKQIFNINNQLDVIPRGSAKRRAAIVAEQNIKQTIKKLNEGEEKVYDTNVGNFYGFSVEVDQISDIDNQNSDSLKNENRNCLLARKRKLDVHKEQTLDEKRRVKKEREWRRKGAVANITIKQLLLSKYIPSNHNPSKSHKVSEQMVAFKLVQLEKRSDTSIQEFKYILGIDENDKKLEYKPYEKFKGKAIVPFLAVAKNEYNEGNLKPEITEAVKFFNRKKDSIANSEARRAINRATDFLGSEKFAELPKINLKETEKSKLIPKGGEDLSEKERY